MNEPVRFRIREDLADDRRIQIRAVSTASATVDLLLTEDQILRMAGALQEKEAGDAFRIPPWRNL